MISNFMNRESQTNGNRFQGLATHERSLLFLCNQRPAPDSRTGIHLILLPPVSPVSKIWVFFSVHTIHTLVKVTLGHPESYEEIEVTLKRFLPQVSNLGRPGLICAFRIGIFLQRKVEIPLSSREEFVGKRRNPYSSNPHCANIWDMFPTFAKYHHQPKVPS